MKNPFCVLFFLLCVGGCWYMRTIEKQVKVDWSPCGTTNLTASYHTYEGESVSRYFDDGKRLWRIKEIRPPMSDGAPPVVEMELKFERSERQCTIWKMEHGIKD